MAINNITAKVKITDLAEQLYSLVSAEDVLPIVDITGDASKKITVANLQLWLESNGIATDAQIQAIQAELVQIQNNIDNIEDGTGDIIVDGGTY
tara:strand:- start:746 stop:1027 length:282 start_codon:yes stop_codon:yes gene_type:complete